MLVHFAGDSALTSEEALANFDLGAFYHNWAKMIDECSPNGAVGDTVPGGPGAGNDPASKSSDASWASVFPSVVWGLLKYNGDTTVGQFWPGLTRFIDNEWSHLGSPPDISKIFAQFGDWVPPPSGQGFIADAKAPIQFTAGFSFVNDVAHVRIVHFYPLQRGISSGCLSTRRLVMELTFYPLLLPKGGRTCETRRYPGGCGQIHGHAGPGQDGVPRKVV